MTTMPSPGDAGDAADDTDGDASLSVLAFDLADDRYCVRTDAVATVFGVSETTQLEAAADPWNSGSVTVDGDRVRVVDLPRVFTSAAPTSTRVDDPRLLVLTEVDDDGAHYGWLVDDVHVTRTVRLRDLEQPRVPTRFVAGRFEFADGGAILLDERAIHA